MLITIIVDRVGNTNVFNVIRDPQGGSLQLPENQSMQSITDDDLIEEYLEELENIASLYRNTAGLAKAGQAPQFDHLDHGRKLHQMGETFFRQFFPPALQELLEKHHGHYLFFHIDPKLASIPLEILSNGNKFLWENFYIGKSIKGQHASPVDIVAKENLKMLIIADPTEDLKWARQEGENLYDYLNNNFPERKLQIKLIAGRNISKLSLLNDITDKDLIHYSGHLHYTNELQENGWVLYDNKIVHAREVQKSGAQPLLIFSNSCISGRDKSAGGMTTWYENFASSFLRSGQTNYVGSIWELPDTEQTLDFTLQFYDSLFRGEEVGLSLHKARDYAKSHYGKNDLTWASYLLMGNPKARIFQSSPLVPDLWSNILNPDTVLQRYPFPIAQAYSQFLATQEGEGEPLGEIEALFHLFEQTLLFIGAIIFANYNYFKINRPLVFDPADLGETVRNIFSALKVINALKTEPLISPMKETMFFHKDDLEKMIDWYDLFRKKQIDKTSQDRYIVSLQYLMESFLMDIHYLKNYGFYRIMEAGCDQYSLSGTSEYHAKKQILMPTQNDLEMKEEVTKKSSLLVGSCVIFVPLKRIFLDLSPYLDISMEEGEGSEGEKWNIQIEYHRYFPGAKSGEKGGESSSNNTPSLAGGQVSESLPDSLKESFKNKN